ncbi:magnesium chelatase ATPase subunit I, partial [Methylobacterium hispanicum]
MDSVTARHRDGEPDTVFEPTPVASAPPPAPVFPFSAIVGQDAMREALLIAPVDPLIGG